MPAEKKRLVGVSRVVVVASGKGGVGKTTVAVNMSLALVAAGWRVGLFDADVYGPNAPLMLGLRRHRSPAGYAAFVPVARAGREPYVEPVHRFGLKVMSFGFLVGETDTVLPDPQLAGAMVRQTLLDVRWAPLDYLLVDLPPGSGEPQQGLVQTIHVDGAIVVTTPQDLSMLDASRSLGLFRQAGVPIVGVVENMSHLVCPHCGETVEVFHRTDRRWLVSDDALEVLGRVPLQAEISRSIDAGHPLVQAAPAAAATSAFRDIAVRLAAKLPPT